VVVDADGHETTAGERTATAHEWVPIEADLSAWAGQTVSLKLVADPGPADNSIGDWASWAETRVETLAPQLARELESDVARFRREPGPFPVEGLTVADLRAAKQGRLRYDGQGFAGTGTQYGSFGVLNGVELGNMAPAGGDEIRNVWEENVSVPLTPEAIATLGATNHFALQNPGNDWFKVRRFWVELELENGQKCSSDVSACVFTQPPGWPHGEGVLVPHGQDIEVDICFRLEAQ